jgi:hypothetical protein
MRHGRRHARRRRFTPLQEGCPVRFSGKDRLVIDGPFAETKELIAGYRLWKAASLQVAIDWVKRCPNPRDEKCEYRDPPGVRGRRFR